VNRCGGEQIVFKTSDTVVESAGQRNRRWREVGAIGCIKPLLHDECGGLVSIGRGERGGTSWLPAGAFVGIRSAVTISDARGLNLELAAKGAAVISGRAKRRT